MIQISFIYFSNIEFSQLSSFILFLFAIVGFVITINTYRSSIQQRKIENTFKTLEYLRTHIKDTQINTFIEIFHANNELLGVKYNEFKFEDGRKDTIEYMFSEGGCGNGDIHNMIELFNLVCPTLDKLELKFIWYEYGQIMSKVFSWTSYLDEQKKWS